MVGFKHFQLDFNQIRTDNKAFIEYFRLNIEYFRLNEKFFHSTPRTTEGPRTTKAPTIEVILYINSEHN